MEVGLMKKSSQIAGLCGFVLLLFGIAEFLFSREFSLFTIIHLAGGGALLLFSLAFNLGGVWSSLGERSTRYSANAVLYTVIFLGILVLANVMASRHSARKDLTEGGLFSLSDQSQKVLDNLKEDVQVLAFFQAAKGTGLEDLLKNYARYSSRFTYEFIDPVKNPEKANKHEVTTTDILVVKCGERETKIPGTSEEDITNAILKVANPAQKKIRFLTAHGERDLTGEEEQGYWVAKKALENENYEVMPLELYMIDEVPADTDVLVVAGPQKALEKNELEAIARYVERGGNALFLLDPGNSPGLDGFLAKWGVKVGSNVVVDQVFRLFYGPTLGVDPVVADYGAHDITNEFQGQTLYHMARSVDLEEPLPDGVAGVSLVKTSASSWAETDLDRFFEKSEVARSDEDLSGPVSIAVALTVQAKKAAGEEAGKVETEKDEAAEGREARLVVFGDADFLNNEYLSRMYNADLFLNTINWLAEEEALISIRPKATRGSRVLMTPKETRDIFYLSVLILPEALLLFGLAVWWRRR
jgi:ABC-type uncharacterized transport system involved in gliding motility auxiliary subunit